MAEAKSRKEPLTTRPRMRPKSDLPDGEEDLRDGELEPRESETAVAEATPPPESAPRRAEVESDERFGFDAEVNNRYEEIKRGGTHISELQQMTMPQLLKVPKEEGLTDYTGLKKQDLIFLSLKGRVKQNGLMFREGTLEVLPAGFGVLRSPPYNYLP